MVELIKRDTSCIYTKILEITNNHSQLLDRLILFEVWVANLWVESKSEDDKKILCEYEVQEQFYGSRIHNQSIAT